MSLTVAAILSLYAADSETQEMLILATRLEGPPEGWREYFRKRL